MNPVIRDTIRKCEGGIKKEEVVAEGEVDVLKFEVHHTSALHNCAKRTTS